MKAIIQKVPLPICGVMLGTAALGNLLQSYSETVRSVCGVFAAFLLVLFLLKVFLFPEQVKEDLKKPIMASVFATFPMALMILSTYVKPWIGQGAYVIWILAILLHVILMVYFTARFIVKLKLPQVFASYFIVYVGIAAVAITAPAYNRTGLGTLAFWFGILAFVTLFILVTYRHWKLREIPDPAKPLICIYAAPLSLCLAGYVQSVTPKSYGFLLTMLAVATLLYLFALVKAVGYLRMPFYPSYAAFTFPFVISAIAAKQTMACAAKLGQPLPFLKYLVMVETVIAVALVAYTYIRYMVFLFRKAK